MGSEGWTPMSLAPPMDQPSGAVNEPKGVLHALGDEKACRILGALREPKTVADVANEVEIPQSTAYRKIAKLDDLELVHAVNPDAASNVAVLYHRGFDEIRVRMQPDIRVELV